MHWRIKYENDSGNELRGKRCEVEVRKETMPNGGKCGFALFAAAAPHWALDFDAGKLSHSKVRQVATPDARNG